MERTYCVVDIEATGGNHKNGRIIEIGMVKISQGRVISEYSTLVNPQQPIDKYVSKLTGIADSDLANAPVFAQVAPKIIDFLGESIFVAHNATFDYAYLRAELRKLGINYVSEQLCTIDLSRQIFPNEESYSLGKLCRSLGLEVSDRHRALGDAAATALLFQKLLKTEGIESALKNTMRSAQQVFENPIGQMIVSPEMYAHLPDEPGVFYLNNSDGKILYVGRGESIKTSAVKLFSDNKRYERFRSYQNQIHNIEFELTGNELLAELLYYERVLTENPVLNVHLKQLDYRYCISVFKKGTGLKLGISRAKDKMGIVISFFKDFKTAEKELKNIVSKYQITTKDFDARLIKPAKNHGPENKQLLVKMAKNTVFSSIIEHIDEYQPNGYYAGNGRKAYEKVVFKLENGKFIGYTFIDTDNNSYDKAWIDENIELMNVKDGAKICWHFIKHTNQFYKIL